MGSYPGPWFLSEPEWMTKLKREIMDQHQRPIKKDYTYSATHFLQQHSMNCLYPSATGRELAFTRRLVDAEERLRQILEECDMMFVDTDGSIEGIDKIKALATIKSDSPSCDERRS